MKETQPQIRVFSGFNSKQILSIYIFALLLFFMFMSPYIAFAHPASDELLASYCTRLLVFEVQNKSKVDKIKLGYLNKQKNITTELYKHRISQDKKLNNTIDEISKHIEGISSNFPSDSLDSALKSAKNRYVASTSSAIINYRKGIDQLLLQRKSRFNTALNKFESEVNQILLKSKKDCGDKVDVHLIFDEVTVNLKKSLDDFKNSIVNINNISSEVESIVLIRNKAIIDANNNFKQDLINSI